MLVAIPEGRSGGLWSLVRLLALEEAFDHHAECELGLLSFYLACRVAGLL
jgi:hypothetical protein